ncbi:DNA repair protein Rad9 [Mactra antiquata]
MVAPRQYQLFFYWIIYTSLFAFGLKIKESPYCPSEDHMIPSPCKHQCESNAECNQRIEGAICCLGGCINEEATLAGDKKEYFYMCVLPNPCDMGVCQNDGSCFEQDDFSYECLCKPGYEGKNCSIEINECKSNPCQAGGECIDLVGNYTCCCPIGRAGKNCEEELNECSNSAYYENQCGFKQCKNYSNAVCIMKPHFYIEDGDKLKEVTDECEVP